MNPLSSTLPELKDIEGIHLSPWDDWVLIMSLILSVIIVLALIFIITKLIKRRQVKVNPYEKAQIELKHLTPATEDCSRYYFELSHILRSYYSAVYSKSIIDMTSAEIEKELHSSYKIFDISFEDFIAFLKRSDAAKFAQQYPGKEKIKDDFRFVKQFIEVSDKSFKERGDET